MITQLYFDLNGTSRQEFFNFSQWHSKVKSAFRKLQGSKNPSVIIFYPKNNAKRAQKAGLRPIEGSFVSLENQFQARFSHPVFGGEFFLMAVKGEKSIFQFSQVKETPMTQKFPVENKLPQHKKKDKTDAEAYELYLRNIKRKSDGGNHSLLILSSIDAVSSSQIGVRVIPKSLEVNEHGFCVKFQTIFSDEIFKLHAFKKRPWYAQRIKWKNLSKPFSHENGLFFWLF